MTHPNARLYDLSTVTNCKTKHAWCWVDDNNFLPCYGCTFFCKNFKNNIKCPFFRILTLIWAFQYQALFDAVSNLKPFAYPSFSVWFVIVTPTLTLLGPIATTWPWCCRINVRHMYLWPSHPRKLRFGYFIIVTIHGNSRPLFTINFKNGFTSFYRLKMTTVTIGEWIFMS